MKKTKQPMRVNGRLVVGPKRAALEMELTPQQWVLVKKHGTPAAFAAACYKAVGEISMDEAAEAIKKYNREWRLAGLDSIKK